MPPRRHRRDGDGRHLRRPAPAVQRVAFPPRHPGRPPRGRRRRPRPLPLRHDPRLPGPRHPGVPLHGRRRRRQGHPLRSLRHLRHPGAVRRGGEGPGGPPRLPARQPRHDRGGGGPEGGPGPGRGGGGPGRAVLARPAGGRAHPARRRRDGRRAGKIQDLWPGRRRTGGNRETAGPRRGAAARRRAAPSARRTRSCASARRAWP